jgi:membrane protease YdiL (CAAX protease family)
MAIFWILSFAIAWAITVPPALAQHGLIGASPVQASLGILIGLAPIIAAAVAAALQGQGKAYWTSLGRLPQPLWAAVAILLPPALLLAANATQSIRIDTEGLAPFALLWLVLAFGEEAGWRGFALPRLVERYGFWIGSLILGVVWCAWHYPKLLGSPFLGDITAALPLIGLFSLQIVIANFILCWLYYRSGRSVIAATLFHTSFNVVSTAYFAAATDMVITGSMTAIVVAIALLDRPFLAGLEPKQT